MKTLELFSAANSFAVVVVAAVAAAVAAVEAPEAAGLARRQIRPTTITTT
jgi:hypothetical protein